MDSSSIHSDDEPVLNLSVKWIRSFSSASDFGIQQSFPLKVFNILFSDGKKSLIRPFSVIPLGEKKWFVLDQGLQNGLLIDHAGGKIVAVDGPESSLFPSLIAAARTDSGMIFFTDSRLNKIYRLEPGNKTVGPFAEEIDLKRPTGIAFSEARSEIWVSETGAHRLSVLNLRGEIIRHIGKRGELPGEFNYPTSIWIDRHGTVYVVDAMNFRVQILSSDGRVLSVFGEAGDATGYFSRPKGIASDSHGNIYVVDGLFHNVQIFDPRGTFLSNFGEQGGDNGHFWLPQGIYIDSNDFIYIADSYNGRIQVYQLLKD